MKIKGSRRISKIVVVLVIFSQILFISQESKADSTKVFLMSVTYGTLAGTLLGAASLAFVDRPGDKLQHVARGASLGLYAGILLGLYLVYAVPDQYQENPSPDSYSLKRFMVYPLISERRGIHGASFDLTVLNF